MSNPTVQELFSLKGKVALITGATGYLGTAMAQALAEAGAQVIVSSRNLEKSQALLKLLPAIEGKSHGAVQIDQMDEASLTQGFQDAVSFAGQIDILINNGNEPQPYDWTNVTAEAFRRQLDNLTGYFLLSRLFHTHIVARKSTGSLVLLGSMYGLVGSYPETYEGICAASPVSYHAMKGGVIQMNRHLAVYWAKDGIRVNCLSPGPFPPDWVSPDLKGRLTEKSPMKRMGKPEELKGAIVFLASDASSYMTGQNLVIDGGWTAW
ncbi:SDR family oxidoreductase [Planctomicrobium sp. SH661]|uniref:SDR family oxidoreductase n=1 Tax=Planctomicrobium sp. SH661 TaxID=3448124 RepID=UPI003F5BD200